MATQNIYALTDTWNAGGTTFTAIKMDVLDTASAAGSLLMDLQVGGSSQFSVTKAGVASVSSTLELGHASDTTLSRSSAGVLAVEGVVVPTISSTNILTNKTLSSPTLSGTVAGASTFSGNTIFSGGLNSSSSTGLNLTYASGAQGSSLSLARPATSTSLAGNVVIDVNGNSLRIYEVGGSFRGVTVDLTTMGSQSPLATLDTAQTLSNKTLSGVTMDNGTNIVLNTTTGTKIGTSTSQKLGFFNATPVVQPTAVADATGAGDVVAQLNALLSRMRNLGLIAT